MSKLKITTEFYLKLYFQIRFYLFLASLHYVIFNYHFTFTINQWEKIFLFMYIFAAILMVFSGIYCFLLSRIIIKDISKKVVFFINSTLMSVSLCIFIYSGFFTQNNSLQTIVFVLLPFLSFNIVSWLVTKRAINKNIIVSRKFLKNTVIWWIFFSILFYLVWVFQPYNRIIIKDNYIKETQREISQWWIDLDAFNTDKKQNELFILFYNCRTGNFESDCLGNPYFWQEFSAEYESFQELKNDNFELYKTINTHDIYEKIVYENLDKQVYVKLLDREKIVQNISKQYFYYRWNDFYNSSINNSPKEVTTLYRLLIDYNMYYEEYYRANELINNYYNFIQAYDSGSTFEIGYWLVQNYFSQLEENWYWEIKYPKNISRDKINYISSFTRRYMNRNNDFLYKLPNILFVFNKQELNNYYYFHLKNIQNNHFIHAYKNPLFYYIWNNIILKIMNDLKYINRDFVDTVEFYDYILKKSEY